VAKLPISIECGVELLINSGRASRLNEEVLFEGIEEEVAAV
jgi:hypothetical protein